jgi:hypothetical protein
MPTRCTGQELLNPQGRKAWCEDGPTGGRDLWEMHGVWEWDSTKHAGTVLSAQRNLLYERSSYWSQGILLLCTNQFDGTGYAHGITC